MRHLVLVAMLLFAGSAAAHTRSETRSEWLVDGATVHLRFTVPELEARRITADGALPSDGQLGAYVAARVGAAAAGQACDRTEGPRAVAAAPGFRRLEFSFHCAGSEGLSVTSTAWFDLVASHTNFARIDDGHGGLVEQLLTADHASADVTDSRNGNALENAGLFDFVSMGMMHIFTGIDHMSFMLGLVLISRRVRDLLFVVTGFTLGHSFTLALAVTGLVRPQADAIDALVAITIALIGAEIVAVRTRRPWPVAATLGGVLLAMWAVRQFGGPILLPGLLLLGSAIFTICYLLLSAGLGDAGRVRLVITLVFGLIHGFGFASNLLDQKLPADRIAELLVGFNAGVEVGQVTVVLGAVALAAVVARTRLGLRRALAADIGAAALVAEGLCWFVQRSVG